MSILSTKSVSIALGASLCGVSGYFIYQYLKADETQTTQDINITRIIKVPINYVAIIIGRGGSTIKDIEYRSLTKISIYDAAAGAEESTCTITGPQDCCDKAEREIMDIICNHPREDCVSIWVPKQTIGKIMGLHCERNSEIFAIAGTRLEFSDIDCNRSQKKITIRGTRKQVQLARSCIEDVVANYVNIAAALAKREPRVPAKNSTGDLTKNAESPEVERLTTIPGQTDSPFEVYVSAMIDPSRFWLQIVGPKAKELDLLVEEMTEYYRNPEMLEWHKFDTVAEGDLVAATFQYDNKWYRAEILKLINNGQAELYYVDYGDTDTVATSELYKLRTDFLRLHFQAIECFLAGVEPVGENWTEEAVDKFEEWTHVAQWQKLSAKVNEYCVREKTRAKREGSPVPGVDLFDVANDTDIDIAHELVRQGYAVYKKEATRSNSRATSVSNVSHVSNTSNDST